MTYGTEDNPQGLSRSDVSYSSKRQSRCQRLTGWVRDRLFDTKEKTVTDTADEQPTRFRRVYNWTYDRLFGTNDKTGAKPSRAMEARNLREVPSSFKKQTRFRGNIRQVLKKKQHDLPTYGALFLGWKRTSTITQTGLSLALAMVMWPTGVTGVELDMPSHLNPFPFPECPPEYSARQAIAMVSSAAFITYQGRELFLSLRQSKARPGENFITKTLNTLALRNAFTMIGPVRKLFQPLRDIPRVHCISMLLQNTVLVPFQVLFDTFEFIEGRQEFRKQLQEMMPTIAKGGDDSGAGEAGADAERPQDSASTPPQKKEEAQTKKQQRRVPLGAGLGLERREGDSQARGKENKRDGKEPKKPKEKKKGVADSSRARDALRAEAAITRQPEGPTPEQVEHERQRIAGLTRVHELQAVYPLSVETVETELRALVNFLPEGRLVHTEGIEWKISWRDHRGRMQNLKFETPHGRDANQFRGRRLNGVLDKIVLAWLWGWEEDRIQQYMSEHLGSCLLKLPGFIYNALVAPRE